MRHSLIFVILLSFLITSPAWAGIKPGSFSLSPMYGGHIFDNDQNLDDASFWSLGLGYNLTEHAALEAVYSQTDADGENTTDSDAKVRTFRLDALYHFLPENQLIPYLAVGLGEINSNPEVGQNREHLLANIGGGIKYFFNDVIALRMDLRYLLDFPEPENNLLYSAGLVFQFGGPAATPVPVAVEQPAPTDADGDGVFDEMDQCPNTPQGAPVNSDGCPLDSDNDGVFDHVDQCPNTPQGAPVNSLGCPLDSDKDGVFDYLDKCPDTPPGAAVNSVGCPLDSDADGVYDYLDKCPNTPRGVSIDANGCTSKLTLQINFGLDSNEIGPTFDAEIAKAAQCINDYPGNLVYIDGHTDSQGPAAYNQKLSERRATAVKNRLVEKFNIAAERMTARGFGESVPVADNTTAEGQFLNRRVEVACGAAE